MISQSTMWYGGTSPAAYCIIKACVIIFSLYLVSYYSKYGIRVNCISPGGIIDKRIHHFLKDMKINYHLRDWIDQRK